MPDRPSDIHQDAFARFRETILWASAIGGGVVTYSAGGSQKVAVAAGLTSIFWPTEQATAKIVILGLR